MGEKKVRPTIEIVTEKIDRLEKELKVKFQKELSSPANMGQIQLGKLTADYRNAVDALEDVKVYLSRLDIPPGGSDE